MMLAALLMTAPGMAIAKQRAPKPLTEAQLKAYPEARGLPADVQQFIVYHSDCEHWAGEEPYDAPRRREIERGIAASCKGLDASAVTLRKRYAKHPKITALLRNYETVGL
jgi:hypothetical protein